MTELNIASPNPDSQPATLVCVSSEAESSIALRFGCLRAKRRNHRVTILHVLEPTEFQGLTSITDAIREEREEQADQLLLEMERQATEQGIEEPELIIREDTLWNGIVSAIEENPNINLIILAVRPDSHRGPKLMSALTDELGNSIKVPIMVVPGNLTEEQIELLS